MSFVFSYISLRKQKLFNIPAPKDMEKEKKMLCGNIAHTLIFRAMSSHFTLLSLSREAGIRNRVKITKIKRKEIY